jgi:hypothetical protein
MKILKILDIGRAPRLRAPLGARRGKFGFRENRELKPPRERPSDGGRVRVDYPIHKDEKTPSEFFDRSGATENVRFCHENFEFFRRITDKRK